MATTGYIPNEVHFYNRPEQTVTERDIWWGRRRDHLTTTKCIPSFPVSGRSKADSKTRENAQVWAVD